MTILPNKPGTISGSSVSIQPSFENMKNCGIMTAGYGIIRDDSISRNILFLPGNRNLANENAARLEVNVPTIVTVTAIIKLFLIPLSSGPASHISLYLSKWNGRGIHTGGRANTSCLSLNEVDSIQSNGPIMNTAPIKSRTKIMLWVTLLLLVIFMVSSLFG